MSVAHVQVGIQKVNFNAEIIISQHRIPLLDNMEHLTISESKSAGIAYLWPPLAREMIVNVAGISTVAIAGFKFNTRGRFIL